eukprot:8931242-Lingulodinium_polyedra.AAC.1
MGGSGGDCVPLLPHQTSSSSHGQPPEAEEEEEKKKEGGKEIRLLASLTWGDWRPRESAIFPKDTVRRH